MRSVELAVLRKRSEKPHATALSQEERDALYKIQHEATEASSVLRSNGRGGLPPSLVLHVLRRDEFRCKRCGNPGNDDNGGLTVHHKAGAKNLVSEALLQRSRGDKYNPTMLTAICHHCHDDVHDQDRAARET